MVNTAHLLRLCLLAEQRGAQLLLAGDPAQISSIGPGGLFGALVADPETGAAQRLWVVRRAGDAWEAHAQQNLRARYVSAIRTYAAYDRVIGTGGDPDEAGEAVEMLADRYVKAAADEGDVLALAGTNAEVLALNAAIAERLRPNDPRTAFVVRDTTEMSYTAGDTLLATEICRAITSNRGNALATGQRWRIETVRDDGTLRCRSVDRKDIIEIPESYWRRTDPDSGLPRLLHGWAATVHRSQGATVRDALVLTSPTLDARTLYVAMTRGTTTNVLVGPGDVSDVVATAEAALRRDHAQDAAIEAHRLGLADRPRRLGPSRP